MGKEKQAKNNTTTILQNKKSSNAQSRTIPVASQLSKGNVLETSNKDNKTSNKRAMRDYCMETDLCMLRRYCKTKNYKLNKKLSDTKTSINKELVTLESSKTDESACGDTKEQNIHAGQSMEDISANLTDLVIQNLNQLLREWIENYLFNNEDTKKKIQNILDSMLRKLEANANVSSCSTYTVDIRIRGSSSKTTNAESNIISCINLEQKPIKRDLPKCKTYSSITVPQTRKHFSIISTLSIPRFVHTCQHQMSGKMLRNSFNKIRKAYNRNILLTISNSDRILSSASSLDLLEISTKSLTKHFATCHDTTTVKECEKKRRIVFIPSSYYKFPGSTSITNLNEELISTKLLDIDPMPSLVKCIFTDELSNMESNFFEAQHDQETMTDEVLPIRGLQTFCENATNVSPQVTVNMATGNDDLRTHLTSGIDLRKEPMRPEMLKNPKAQPCSCCDDDKTNTCKPCFKSVVNEAERDPLLTIDFLDQKDFNSNTIDKEPDYEKPISVPCASKCGLLKKILPSRLKRCCFKEGDEKGNTNFTDAFEKIRNKHFSYIYKKTDNKLKNNEFLEHFQDMFKYFANYKGKRNINLDIRINVYPTLEEDVEAESKNEPPCSVCNIKANEENIVCDITKVTVKSSTDQGKCKSQITHFCSCQPKIISLYDDAQKSCIEHSEKLDETSNYLSNQVTTTADLEIAKEVCQLRAIIKDLAVTAEKFVQDHLNNTIPKLNVKGDPSNQTMLFRSNVECIHTMAKENAIRRTLEYVKNSKATQFSNNLSCQKLSWLKIKMEVDKKNSNEFQNRLTKKSTSYNVIDSETLLKVTDMTSAAQTMPSNAVADEALTCSLPRCKSLYDISVESNKQKLVAFYCDEVLRNHENKSGCNMSCVHCPVQTQVPESCSIINQSCLSNTTDLRKQSKSNEDIHSTQYLSEGDRACETTSLCSSVLITIDKPPEKKFPIHNRRIIGIREGSLYSLLLLIPVLIILWLLYIFIIKDKLKPKVYSSNKFSNLLKHANNGSRLNITLSDLGF